MIPHQSAAATATDAAAVAAAIDRKPSVETDSRSTAVGDDETGRSKGRTEGRTDDGWRSGVDEQAAGGERRSTLGPCIASMELSYVSKSTLTSKTKHLSPLPGVSGRVRSGPCSPTILCGFSLPWSLTAATACFCACVRVCAGGK